ncbi:hypothetical protein TIFTF001_015242 [Ficus carica]|uniref:Uncharacterized protein n=1 Tax=Ficus carica TaxID=3494 RepID=A0AA88A7H1_FICCA|nr:hypothetical protein TIFTF001_015242 [Ficus carica]
MALVAKVMRSRSLLTNRALGFGKYGNDGDNIERLEREKGERSFAVLGMLSE